MTDVLALSGILERPAPTVLWTGSRVRTNRKSWCSERFDDEGDLVDDGTTELLSGLLEVLAGHFEPAGT